MGVGAAHKHHMQHSRKLHVTNVGTGTANEARVFTALHLSTHEGSVGHRNTLSCRNYRWEVDHRIAV